MRAESKELRRALLHGAFLLGIVALCGVSSHATQDAGEQLQSESVLPAKPAPNYNEPLAHARRVSSYRFRERLHDYVQSDYQPFSLIGAALVGAYGQAINYPPEWGQGAKGFGRRTLSSYGSLLVDNSIVLGVSSLDHEDTRYVRCECAEGDLWGRLGHVFGRTFRPPRDNGGHTFAFSRILGDYGSGFVANTWYPAGHSNATNAVRLGSTSALMDVGINLVREFVHPHLVGWN